MNKVIIRPVNALMIHYAFLSLQMTKHLANSCVSPTVIRVRSRNHFFFQPTLRHTLRCTAEGIFCHLQREGVRLNRDLGEDAELIAALNLFAGVCVYTVSRPWQATTRRHDKNTHGYHLDSKRGLQGYRRRVSISDAVHPIRGRPIGGSGGA